MTEGRRLGYILERLPALDSPLRALAGRKAVFFAGLPGTGKSLFVHQLAHLAHDDGRRVHLLQWDVSRPVFEAAPAGQRYPVIDGVTHVLIRRAVGLWARAKVLEWWQAQVGAGDILIGEVPLAGNRLIELVTPADDAAEVFLTSDQCVFALPVPSNEVRRHIEAQRRHRFESPLHARELEDAPPDVMRDTWLEMVRTGHAMALLASLPAGDVPFDSTTYRVIYEHLLQHRNCQVVDVSQVLPTDVMSVYDYPQACELLLPREDEIEDWIRRAELELGV